MAQTESVFSRLHGGKILGPTARWLFSVTENDAADLIARHKDRFDESLPSGNSVAASSLSKLYRRTGQHIYARLADQLFQTFAAEIVQIPTSYGYTLKALQDHRDGSIGPLEFAGSGSVRVSVRVAGRSDNRIQTIVEVTLADGCMFSPISHWLIT